MSYSKKSLIIVIPALLVLSACVPAVVVGTAKVGQTAMEERSAGNVVDDAFITATVKRLFAEEDFDNLFSKSSVDTTEGRVLLTGSVRDHDLVLRAVKIAWTVRGVKEVINELEVKDKDLKTRAHDRWISTQINTKLIMDKNIRSVNYTIDVNDGIVFITGIGQSAQELDAVIEVARKVRGVKRVVNHATLKDDPRRLAQ
ncbi:MAG: BON domain-containing protein [Proteobacteria bacterium]|nr:BON domain-containing protein [Pseudomonadota bacterium]